MDPSGMQVFSFTPSIASPPFKFRPVLDGTVFTVIARWNVAGQRWYLECYSAANVLIFSLPLVSSADPIAILSLSSDAAGLATAVLATPHYRPLGSQVQFLVSGASPDGFTGYQLCSIIDSVTVSYALPSDLGIASPPGQLQAIVNLAGGYFDNSVLFYLGSANQIIAFP